MDPGFSDIFGIDCLESLFQHAYGIHVKPWTDQVSGNLSSMQAMSQAFVPKIFVQYSLFNKVLVQGNSCVLGCTTVRLVASRIPIWKRLYRKELVQNFEFNVSKIPFKNLKLFISC